MNALVKELIENGQDFEFYPTTQEMLNLVYQHISANRYRSHRHKLLDIGCGTCNFNKFLGAFNEGREYGKVYVDYYVIEKSKVLIDLLPEEAIVVGTDFHEAMLIDKDVDRSGPF